MTYSKEGKTAGFGNAKKDKLRADSDTTENTKGIENHIKAAEHFSLASKLHYEASRYHQEGNHEAANQSALLAIGHASIATECQMKDAKYHAEED